MTRRGDRVSAIEAKRAAGVARGVWSPEEYKRIARLPEPEREKAERQACRAAGMTEAEIETWLERARRNRAQAQEALALSRGGECE